MWPVVGRELLLIGGMLLLAAGAVMLLAYLFPASPLTATWRWGPVTVVFPIGLSLLLSVVLTILLNVLLRGR